jgi:hypothetical protein
VNSLALTTILRGVIKLFSSDKIDAECAIKLSLQVTVKKSINAIELTILIEMQSVKSECNDFLVIRKLLEFEDSLWKVFNIESKEKVLILNLGKRIKVHSRSESIIFKFISKEIRDKCRDSKDLDENIDMC